MGGVVITVNDLMQTGYVYSLSEPEGKNFAPRFTPFLAPAEMLSQGVFEGKYMNDCREEFPESWFEKAKLSDMPDETMNLFGIKSRQPLSAWRERDWIIGDDPRGWFQWYCRYYRGRRDNRVDERQVQRWLNFTRHAGQIRKNCVSGDLSCRPRQRQALLQWAHDPFI